MTGYPNFRLAFVGNAIDESTKAKVERERFALCAWSFPLHHVDPSFPGGKRDTIPNDRLTENIFSAEELFDVRGKAVKPKETILSGQTCSLRATKERRGIAAVKHLS